MKEKREILAMILAGGQGTRLREITENLAKPAVTFAGKYRIIDFTLSNCSNSNIDIVGILTQYQPLILSEHIGIGTSWDLEGGVKILPPYTNKDGVRVYKGTANAIYENINFIEGYQPEYVLILSGDHIYNMDYSKMLEFHKQKNSDVTIATLRVPKEEAYRFGILNTDEEYKVIEFEEKPSCAKSDLASMGIYIFNWNILKQLLTEDSQDENSQNDFGKNIMPKLVEEHYRFFAYPFEGYWKDVGTVESLWEANMDFLKEEQVLDLGGKAWRNYSVNPNSPPQYIAPQGVIVNSLVNEGCIIEGRIENSVISPDVQVGLNSQIKDSIVMHRAVIEEGALIYKSILLDGVVVKKDSVIGDPTGNQITVYAGEEGEKNIE